MLEFLILVAVLGILMRIPVGQPEIEEPVQEPDEVVFLNVDDVMEYRELMATGWRGSAADFYKLKEEE